MVKAASATRFLMVFVLQGFAAVMSPCQYYWVLSSFISYYFRLGGPDSALDLYRQLRWRPSKMNQTHPGNCLQWVACTWVVDWMDSFALQKLSFVLETVGCQAHWWTCSHWWRILWSCWRCCRRSWRLRSSYRARTARTPSSLCSWFFCIWRSSVWRGRRSTRYLDF